MKARKQKRGCRAAELTAEEHLWLHRKMERRAHELWLAGGCRRSRLNDWLRAEREIWPQFERMRGHLDTAVGRRALA
jgi:hypothetical protein